MVKYIFCFVVIFISEQFCSYYADLQNPDNLFWYKSINSTLICEDANYPNVNLQNDSVLYTHSEAIRKLYENFKNISHEELCGRYTELKPYLGIKDKQGLLYSCIGVNNFDLVKKLVNDLKDENAPLINNRYQQSLNRKYFPWENCDTVLVDYVFNEIGWFCQNIQDSVFRLIRAIEKERNDLLLYYLNHGWKDVVNQKAYLDESGDAPFDGFTPLNYSLMQGDTIISEILLDFGAKIGREALSVFANSLATIYTYKLLLNKGLNKNQILDSCLWHPIMYGQLEKVQILLKLGADIEMIKYKTSNTPIFQTIDQYGFPWYDPTYEKLKIMKILIDQGANVNHQNSFGETPLMYSCKIWASDGMNIKLGFAKLLIENNANTSILDKDGNSFWDHVIINQNKIFMDYFATNHLTPIEYRSKYDSISKTINLDMDWVQTIHELE